MHFRHLVMPVAPTGGRDSGWASVCQLRGDSLTARIPFKPLVIFAIASTSARPSILRLVAATCWWLLEKHSGSRRPTFAPPPPRLVETSMTISPSPLNFDRARRRWWRSESPTRSVETSKSSGVFSDARAVNARCNGDYSSVTLELGPCSPSGR